MPQALNVATSVDSKEQNEDTDYTYVTAPLVGTFHQSPSQDAKPFVEVGQRVSKGDKLCIVEAMKVMNEITAPQDGIVKEVLVKEGQMVEFGTKLFAIGE